MEKWERVMEAQCGVDNRRFRESAITIEQKPDWERLIEAACDSGDSSGMRSAMSDAELDAEFYRTGIG
ncbi:hypothetical protein ES702_03938 [subsurface metagenome]